MHKIRKYILTVLFILAFAANSQAYSLREGNILLAEYDQQVTESVGAAGANNIANSPKLKSPAIAFTLTSIPLMMFGGFFTWGVIESNGIGDSCVGSLFVSATISVISTLPGHFYLKYAGDYGDKVAIVTLGKIVSLIPPLVLFGRDFLNSEINYTNSEYLLAFSPWIGIYLYEIIDAPLAAKRYNEKILQQSGLFVVPMAAKGEGRLLVGYRF
ncbi:MAG: hypothetical protein PHE84_13240 [bacterium]|nr:hypothetical protein [bacterium]